MPPTSSSQPVATTSRGTAWRSLALLAGCFVASCGVVAGVLATEFAHYSKSNAGLVEESFQLLDTSLLLGLLLLLVLLAARRLRYAGAALLGMLPVLLLAWLLHGTEGWGHVLALPPAQPTEPSLPTAEPEPAATLFPKTDSARVYTYVEQMPASLTGGGLADLADTLGRKAWLRLEPAARSVEGKARISFVVGPRGGIFLEKIEQGLSPAADAALLAEVRRLPRMQPGKQDGHAVAVRLTAWVQLPPPIP